MNFPIDINAGQFLAFAALAVAVGVAFGIAIGIKLYESYGSDSKRTTTSAANLLRTTTSGCKLGCCLEAR